MSPPSAAEARGPIAWMARNRVTANLLMFLVVVLGVVGLTEVKQEIFPQFDLDTVVVSVPYPGASPAEVEQGIVLAVEEAVRGGDGVKRVTGTASENVGVVRVELLLGADPQKVLADVKNEVDRITTFPEDAEEPQVTLAATRSRVVSLIIHGDTDLSTLHQLAERARAELLASPDVTQVELEGVPPLEISVEVPRESLQAYGLTLDDVARVIAASSLELPGGSVKTRGGEVLVRVADRKRSGAELADIVLLTDDHGGLVRLGDVATIRDGFAETDQASFFDGEPAIRMTAYRVGDETPQRVAAAARRVAEGLDARLPDGIGVEIWDDDSVLLQSRINLLVRNARLGLILVLGVLALFLDLRLAFWVALGIPISFLAAFGLMPGLDVSVNMISLFALIITLGMVVDDAIVVGENYFELRQRGMDRLAAAIEGTREMAVPVTFAVLTTMAAFAPLLFVPGAMGKIFGIMPIVVFTVLGGSLLEAFFVLPAHLGHGRERPPGRLLGVIHRGQARFARWLSWFTDSVYTPQLAWAVRHRYVVMALAVASLLFAVGLVGGGIIPFSFFPKIEGDVVTASARLPYGVPIARTEEVLERLEAAAAATIDELDASDAVEGQLAIIGEMHAGGHMGDTTELGSHLLTMQVQLVPSGERSFTAAEFQRRWREHTPPMAGIEVLAFNSDIGPAATAAAVDVQLSHSDPDVLAAASAELAEQLRTFTDLTQVENGYASGKDQVDFKLRPEARALGLTSAEVARQIRSAFYGAEAVREQRDRNELKIMVRLPGEQRVAEQDIDQLRVRTPRGDWVPLAYVAELSRNRAPTAIKRESGRRIVDVTADLASGVRSNQPVLDELEARVLPALRAAWPGLRTELVGQQRQQDESMAALGRGYIVALFGIYALLAIPFKSYTQPAVVMSAIPFGFVGAVLGHLVMGYELSLISMFGIIALSGVVVNDSLVLIDAVNNHRRRHDSTPLEAIMWAGPRRLRPILLTSLTTFFGLAPMILETEVQARFLVPMAISLGFGILFSTAVTLLLVPALYISLQDWHRVFGRLMTRLRPVRTTVEVEAEPGR
ncbi:MAG: efflux RND transporter permease subunit [Deltaproteobacteria bacterium]|nr:MAG: efflux RND transporter permease subunit [Deltaproteobacteria bacterium]